MTYHSKCRCQYAYIKVWKQPSEQASQCIPHATNIWKTCFVPVPTVSHSRVYNICATCRPWRRARSYGTSARQASQNKANHGKLLEGPGLPGHANSKRSTFEFLPHNSFRTFLWCNFGYAHPGEFDHHMLYIFELNPSRHLSTASPSRLREWWSSQSHGAWGHIKICWFHHFIWYQSSDQDLLVSHFCPQNHASHYHHLLKISGILPLLQPFLPSISRFRNGSKSRLTAVQFDASTASIADPHGASARDVRLGNRFTHEPEIQALSLSFMHRWGKRKHISTRIYSLQRCMTYTCVCFLLYTYAYTSRKSVPISRKMRNLHHTHVTWTCVLVYV